MQAGFFTILHTPMRMFDYSGTLFRTWRIAAAMSIVGLAVLLNPWNSPICYAAFPEIVILKSQVNRVFHTSLEVGVEVYSENVLTGEKKHTTTAFVTFVAIDQHTRKPKPVPPLVVKTEEEKQRFHEAGRRRAVRLALRFGKK